MLGNTSGRQNLGSPNTRSRDGQTAACTLQTTVPAAIVPTSLEDNAVELLPGRLNVLLGVSGSVAAIKLEELAERLARFSNVKIVATYAAMNFIDGKAHWGSTVLRDEHDWRLWAAPGDPVEHIKLRRWADIFLIAPLSANTLAKMAQGMCDNLLTCIVRAWDFSKPLLVAPAMNTFMWESPFTCRHLDELRALSVEIVPPVEKKLACGDVGNGAMAPVDELVDTVRRHVDQLAAAAHV